jgi:hypothetical protein
MSLPRNHHHVSICQIQNFWNNEENNIWLYDKELNNFYSKTTAKSIFSERDSNSRIYNDVLDHCTLENELRDFYETPFTPCYKRLESIVLGLTYDKKDLKNDLMTLARYGIAGLLRPPSKKKETDDALKNILFKELYELSTDELKEQFNEMRNSVFGSKYSNTLNYKDFVDSVLEKMGDLFFEIYLIQTDNLFFLLPDKPSFGAREKINVYFNPDINEYAKIGIPLSSKIFLHVESKKLRNENDKVFFISKSNINFLNQLNSSIFNLADKTVACESEVYLRSFIKNL